MRAAVYCRVSTDDQEKEGTSLQTQLAACQSYCQQKGYQVIRQFTETYSGLTLDRHQLVQLRDLVRTNDLDVLVIYCLDRLSRNATHGVILRDELDKHHVLLESVTEDIDKSPLGEAITYLRGTFAQVEAEKIRERTMRGKLARLKEGRLPQGTGIGIYGYAWDKTTGHRTVIEHEAKVVHNIFTAIMQGQSFHRIAADLNNASVKTKSGSLWHPLTVRRIAKNPTYTGKTYYGQSRRTSKTKVTARPKNDWILLPAVTPPIVSEELFESAQQAIVQSKDRRPTSPNAAYLLTGMARCAKCGSPLGGTMIQGKYRYYQCRGAKPTATRGKVCDARYIKASYLEELVWKAVVNTLAQPGSVLSALIDARNNKRPNDQALATFTKDINRLRKKLKAYPRREQNLVALLSHEAVTKDIVLDSINTLKQERLRDESQLENLIASRHHAQKAQTPAITLTELSKALRSALWTSSTNDTLQARRSLLQNLRLQVDATPQTWSLSVQLGAYTFEADAFDHDHPHSEPLYDSKNSVPITADDLRDWTNQGINTTALDVIMHPDPVLPDDSPIARMIKELRSHLVTTEQTSA